MKNALVRFHLLLFSIILPIELSARLTPEEYIERYKGLAVQEMKRYGIPASITLAQAGLESCWGSSELAVNANNHFGIKCHGWQGATYRKDAELPMECFRKYDSPEHSYSDHAEFLRYRERYSFLFNLEPTDYKGWADGLLSAGYATNPKYSILLIKIIEKYGLYKYDTNFHPAKTNDIPVIDVNTGIKVVTECAADTYAGLAEQYHIYMSDLIRCNDISGMKKSEAQKGDEKHMAAPRETAYLRRKKR